MAFAHSAHFGTYGLPAGVQLLHHVERQVEPDRPTRSPARSGVEQHVQPLLGRELLRGSGTASSGTRSAAPAAARSALGLRVLLEALALARLPLDVLLERRRAPASFMTPPPVCSFCWLACSGLVLSAISVCFFCVSACTFAVDALPSTDVGNRLQVHERDLRALRERRGRRRRRCRLRGGRRAGLGGTGGCAGLAGGRRRGLAGAAG